jgi:hypothetical protein
MAYRQGGRLDILLPRINQLPLPSFRPQMALFRNFGVNRRNRLCGIQKYASAQFFDFLELAENCSFLDRKLISALNETVDGTT